MKTTKKINHLEFFPLFGFGIRKVSYKKPEFSKNAEMIEIYLPFIKITRSVYEEEVIKLNRQQRRKTGMTYLRIE